MRKWFAGSLCVAAVLWAVPGFCQDAKSSLERYISHTLTQTDIQSVRQQSADPNEDISEQDILQALLAGCEMPDTVSDVKEYITDTGDFGATGELNPWEKKRAELFRYVQSSNWRTWKNISDADRALIQTIQTIAFGLFREAASVCGLDRVMDSLEQRSINEQENREAISQAVSSVAMDIGAAMRSEEHAIDALYVKVQHNAFNLLTINYEDFKKLSGRYPEVAFLFDDLYTFFKWRYELRTADASYKLNENNINVEFRQATYTNSFFAFWELANIAKAQIRQAVAEDEDKLIMLTVSDERDNMKYFDSYAARARYFGRLWNGMQRYGVHKGILSKQLNPKRGAGKPRLRRDIHRSLDPLNAKQVEALLENIRTHYVNTRRQSEAAWSQFVRARDIEQKKQDLLKLQDALKQAVTTRPVMPADTTVTRPQADSTGLVPSLLQELESLL